MSTRPHRNVRPALLPVLWLGLLAAAPLAGCSTTTEAARAERDAPPSLDFERAVDRVRVEIRLFDARTGDALAWSDVVQRAARSDIVLLGEIHSDPVGQAFQAALFEDLLRARPNAALSLEFFERDEQPILDDYLLGLIDEQEFRSASNRTPRNYPPGHEAMVEASRAARGRVIAANAPRRYVRLARTDGLEAISALRDSQRRLVVPPSRLPGGGYAERFREVMIGMVGRSHASPGETDAAAREEAIEGLFLAQSVWDATMADSIADAWFEGLDPILHVAGRFHIERDAGLPQMLDLAAPEAERLTIVMARADVEALPSADRGRADVMVYLGAAPEPEGPR